MLLRFGLARNLVGYARQIELALERAEQAKKVMGELALGGTAVGTGLNAHPRFARLVVRHLAGAIRSPLREAVNHF